MIIDDESDQQTKNVANYNEDPERVLIKDQLTIQDVAESLGMNSNYLAELNNMHVDDVVGPDQEIIKREAQSPNYASIKHLRSVFPHNSYLMYAATSQAELLMSEIDEMRPQFHIYLTPGKSYTGYDFFFRMKLIHKVFFLGRSQKMKLKTLLKKMKGRLR